MHVSLLFAASWSPSRLRCGWKIPAGHLLDTALQQAADTPTASLYAELDMRVEENRSETSEGSTVLSCQRGGRGEVLKIRARDLRDTNGRLPHSSDACLLDLLTLASIKGKEATVHQVIIKI